MLKNDNQLIQHQLFRIKHTEINEIFLVMGIRSFVCALIGVFIPIYLLILGYSLRQVIFVQLALSLTELLFEYVSSLFISKVGPKHVIGISMIPLICHFWLLSTIKIYHWPLWIIGACGGISLALYWQGYHYDFSRTTKKKDATKNVSKIYIIIAILGAVAPFLGGVIITKFGFNILYIIVIGLLFLVFFPLLKKTEVHKKVSIDMKKINFKFIKKDIISYSGMGIESAASSFIWPIFVYFATRNYQSVGFITSVALIITIFVTYLVGIKVNNSNRHNYIVAGSFLDSLIFVLLTFVDSFSQIMSLNVTRSLVGSIRQAPYVSEYYLHADENSRQEYILAMESSIDFVRIIFYILLIGLTYFLPDKAVIIVGLLCGAVGSTMASIMPKAKCELAECKSTSIKLIPRLRERNETN